MTTREPILLMPLTTGKEVRCTEYDCEPALISEKVHPAFVAAWSAMSESARGILVGHWKEGASVILKEGNPDWATRTKGFGSASYDGLAMYCWSEVLRDIPDRVLVTTIVHELAHLAFIAIGEKAHAEKSHEAEFLIAVLLEAWGMKAAHEEADLWLIENFSEYDVGIPRREEPLRPELLQRRRQERQADMDKQAGDRKARREKSQRWFDQVAGTQSGPA
jgi:hypothetical protein